MNYFTLHALASEWNDRLSGAVLVDAWSQSAGELSLALEKSGEASTIRIHCDPKLSTMFRVDGRARARKNTATLFERAQRIAVVAIRAADRDRFVLLDLSDGSAFQIQLFGSRPNVFWIRNGRVQQAFLLNEEWAGKAAPESRSAPAVSTFEEFEQRWRTDRKTFAQAVSATIPLLDRQLAEEVVCRAELDPELSPSSVGSEDLKGLFEGSVGLQDELHSPRPVVYWRGTIAEAFSLIPLRSVPEGWRAETFDSVDEALGVYSKRRLAQRRFMEAYQPLASALEKASRKARRRAEAMLSELDNPSRAEGYEARGHILMAQAAEQPAGRESITLPDILNEGADVSIKLDPSLTVVENAQRYYAKARHARDARMHAEERLASVQAEANTSAALLKRLQALEKYADLEMFLSENKTALVRFTRPEDVGEERLPYRRFEIDGWEIRVGKSAKSNAQLTSKLSGPHDMWLHARGVPGSHVIIRRPGKSAEVPKQIIEAAAEIAAYFSDAKSQPLAPVIVTERKYVRPIKGGAPGLVRVDREDVVMVEPGLP